MIHTLECLCHSCGMEYEIRFNTDEFQEPTHCVGCGIDDDSLEINLKTIE